MFAVVLFGVPHLTVLAITAAVVVGFCAAARRSRTVGPKLRAAEILLAVVMCLTFPYQVVLLFHYGIANVGNFLPLQLCDVAAYVGAFAMVTRARVPSELIYFWGIGATLQTLVTPAGLYFEFPHPAFIAFFAHHSCIVIAAIYVVAGRRDFPRRGAFWRAVLWTEVYLVAVGILNFLFGMNYAFLCSKPTGTESLFDVLGPWPWYLLWLQAAGILTFAVLYVPFYFWNRRRGRRRRVAAEI